MPTYEYLCRDQGHRLEVQQKFTDEPLTVCPICGGSLRKVISAPPIVFKGSGFYRNDSRASSARSSSTAGRDEKDGKPGTNGASSDSAGTGSDGSAKKDAAASGSGGQASGSGSGSGSGGAASGSGSAKPKAAPSATAAPAG